MRMPCIRLLIGLISEIRYDTITGNHRCIIIEGRLDGDSLVMNEHFVYDDGETDRRVWTFERPPWTTGCICSPTDD